MVKLITLLHQVADDTNQVAPHRTANAAVIHLKDSFIGFNHELVVDTDFLKLVGDRRHLFTVLIGEDAVQQGGFASA